jgi:hypothetical protein
MCTYIYIPWDQELAYQYWIPHISVTITMKLQTNVPLSTKEWKCCKNTPEIDTGMTRLLKRNDMRPEFVLFFVETWSKRNILTQLLAVNMRSISGKVFIIKKNHGKILNMFVPLISVCWILSFKQRFMLPYAQKIAVPIFVTQKQYNSTTHYSTSSLSKWRSKSLPKI